MTYKIDATNISQEKIDRILDECSIQEMLHHLKLTAEFCVKYILSTDDYAASVEDTYFDVYDVLRYQPHLTMDDIKAAYESLDKK